MSNDAGPGSLAEDARPDAPADLGATRRERGRRWPPDAFDLAVLALFALLSAWVWILLAGRAGPNRVWTGTDGPFIGDQMQFLGWIAESARHILVDNPFRTHRTAGVFLHPGVVVSGLGVRLGASPAVAFQLWKPVAVLALFGTTRAYVRSLLESTAQRRIALVLALFYISPATLVAQHLGSLSVQDHLGLQVYTTELWPGLYLWGYPFTALAVALVPAALLAYARDRRRGTLGPWAPICCLLCAWLQPWQGATLLGILVASELLLGRRQGRAQFRLLAVNVAAAGAPLVYYALLSRLDAAWARSGRVNLVSYPVLTLVAALAPLGIVALLGYRSPWQTFQDLSLRIWPLTAIVVLVVIQVARVGTYPAHALQGLSIPLAVLAVRGAATLARGWQSPAKTVVGAALAALLLVPSLVNQLNDARSIGQESILSGPEPYFITAEEQAALTYLAENPSPGAVLAPVYLGQVVPERTRRQTWVGIFSWTPDFVSREAVADELFSGRLSPSRALAIVRGSGARFLLSDCHANAPLAGTLAPILESEHRFGCASVYVVRPAS